MISYSPHPFIHHWSILTVYRKWKSVRLLCDTLLNETFERWKEVAKSKCAEVSEWEALHFFLCCTLKYSVSHHIILLTSQSLTSSATVTKTRASAWNVKHTFLVLLHRIQTLQKTHGVSITLKISTSTYVSNTYLYWKWCKTIVHCVCGL
jgi:hypothetical protein